MRLFSPPQESDVARGGRSTKGNLIASHVLLQMNLFGVCGGGELCLVNGWDGRVVLLLFLLVSSRLDCKFSRTTRNCILRNECLDSAWQTCRQSMSSAWTCRKVTEGQNWKSLSSATNLKVCHCSNDIDS